MRPKLILPVVLLFTLGAAALAPERAQALIVKLHWTAPGDDGLLGQAKYYEMRFSLFPIDQTNYLYATPVIVGLPPPSPAGQRDSVEVVVSPGLTYYFALRSQDWRGNWSAISNIAIASPGMTLDAQEDDFRFSSPSPNPASSSTRFSLALPEAGDVQVEVFDMAGRRVKRLAGGWHPAGPQALDWNLTNESGRHVEPGVYLVHARLRERGWTRRVAVVR